MIEIKGACENNLKNINIQFPLNNMTVITGVSGSGKSSLVKKILYPAIKKHLGGHAEQTGAYDQLGGAIKQIKHIEFIDQNPIGKSSRRITSYNVCYTKLLRFHFSKSLTAELSLSAERLLGNERVRTC